MFFFFKNAWYKVIVWCFILDYLLLIFITFSMLISISPFTNHSNKDVVINEEFLHKAKFIVVRRSIEDEVTVTNKTTAEDKEGMILCWGPESIFVQKTNREWYNQEAVELFPCSHPYRPIALILKPFKLSCTQTLILNWQYACTWCIRRGPSKVRDFIRCLWRYRMVR